MTSNKSKQKKETFENIQDFKEYEILKDNNYYKFKISKIIKDIYIQYKNYELKLDYKDLQEKTKSDIYSLDDTFIYITDLFEDNMINIKEIIEEKEVIILLNIFNNNKLNQTELNLIYKNPKDMLIEGLKKKNTKLTDEICDLKQRIEKLEKKQKHYQISNINFSFIPRKQEDLFNYKIEKNVSKHSYSDDLLDNVYTVFKSTITDLLYLVYSSKNNSLIVHNLISDTIIGKIKKAHENFITNIRYFFDKNNKKDLVMSISSSDNNIKIWDFLDYKCIFNVNNINPVGDLDSACILNYNKENYVLTSNDDDNDIDDDINFIPSGPIKEYDFNGNFRKEINDSSYRTLIIDTYYERNNIYIITGNAGFCKSYDYLTNKEYRIYRMNSDNTNLPPNNGHCSVIINSYKDLIVLIGASWDGNLRIWNFHSGQLISRFNIGCVQGICLSRDKKYLFVGCDDKIKVVNSINGKIVKCLNGKKGKEITTIKRVNIPQYGECLLSKSAENGQIKLWIKEK